MEDPEIWTIYILRCVDGKFYVGKTRDLNRRLSEHLSGEGSKFTSLYPPIPDDPLYAFYHNCSAFDEDKYVKKMMLRYGIDNVRGGMYSMVELSLDIKRSLEREFERVFDVCTRCGLRGHFTRNCNFDRNALLAVDIPKCERCGRKSHSVDECYARTTVTGEQIPTD